EIANPHRMGAALTYARRYALFTLVGIAGEDDLDAPDLCMQAPAAGSPTTGSPFHWPTQGNGKARGGAKLPSSVILPVNESAALRDRLLGELAVLESQESATKWAREALPAKNSLTAADARLLEEAFGQKIAGWPPAEAVKPSAGGDASSISASGPP